MNNSTVKVLLTSISETGASPVQKGTCHTDGSSPERISPFPRTEAQGLISGEMIDYDSRYHGFCSTESMTSERIADFLDRFSLTIRKTTFVVLDNAKVHRSKYMKEMRKIWEKRGLYLFFLPPYSPHLNIAETLWRMLKGQWIQPADYVSTDNLFYAVNRGLAGLGTTHFINFSKRA